LKLSPGAHGRTVVASGVVWSVRSGAEWLPSMLAAGSRHSGSLSIRDRRPTATPCPTDADASKKPNGSPGPDLSGSTRKWPRPDQRRADEPRALRPRARARSPDRAASPGSVVGLWTSSHGFGSPAGVAERVRDLEAVADVPRQLAVTA
jgi:hypothetical protein